MSSTVHSSVHTSFLLTLLAHLGAIYVTLCAVPSRSILNILFNPHQYKILHEAVIASSTQQQPTKINRDEKAVIVPDCVRLSRLQYLYGISTSFDKCFHLQ